MDISSCCNSRQLKGCPSSFEWSMKQQPSGQEYYNSEFKNLLQFKSEKAKSQGPCWAFSSHLAPAVCPPMGHAEMNNGLFWVGGPEIPQHYWLGFIAAISREEQGLTRRVRHPPEVLPSS